MRQSDNQAYECRNREEDATSHSRSSSSFSSKLMCRKTEQERKPSTQQCMEYCGPGTQSEASPREHWRMPAHGPCSPRAQGIQVKSGYHSRKQTLATPNVLDGVFFSL